MADPYRAPTSSGDGSDSAGALSLHAAPVHPAVRPDTETTTFAVLKIRAHAAAPGARRPLLSAVLVLDVSGSMQGEPLAQVLHSARRLAEILDDTDRLGVVTFSAGAATVAELLPLAEGRRDLLAKLPQIFAEGGTNIAGGLAEAALLFPRREPGERQIMVLMSDGEPNIGAVSPRELGAAARRLKARDVAISTLGYGARHNDDVLAQIAEGGGGRYTFVIDPKLAEASFIRALGAQLDVVAEKVELLLAPGPDVEIVRVLEDPPTAVGAGGLRVTLPDLIVGDELNVVVELRLAPRREPGPMKALAATLSCQLAGTSRAVKTTSVVEILCTRHGSLATDPAAHEVASVALAAEMREKARALSDRGSFADAEAILRKAQELVAATPGFVQGGQGALADAYETLADEILVMAKRPQREEYEVYKRAVRDHADFAMSGAKVRGGAKLGDAPPSSRVLLDRAMAGVSMPRAHLRVVTGPRAGVRLSLAKDRFVIGRSATGTDLTLPDANVSRQHSMIELIGGAFWLVDMGSTNGPLYKGNRVTRLRLTNGDEFLIGDSLLRYEEEEP
jgi:Ca-activated chloride channel family protein